MCNKLISILGHQEPWGVHTTKLWIVELLFGSAVWSVFLFFTLWNYEKLIFFLNQKNSTHVKDENLLFHTSREKICEFNFHFEESKCKLIWRNCFTRENSCFYKLTCVTLFFTWMQITKTFVANSKSYHDFLQFERLSVLPT